MGKSLKGGKYKIVIFLIADHIARYARYPMLYITVDGGVRYTLGRWVACWKLYGGLLALGKA